jgi:hypothetical protein
MQAKSREDKERVAALKAAAGDADGEAGGGSTGKKPKKEKRPTIKSAYMVCRQTAARSPNCWGVATSAQLNA